MTMGVEIVDIDSRLMNGAVLEIKSFDASEDFVAFERKYIEELNPSYVSCRLPLDSMSDVLTLQHFGFMFIECQIRSSYNFDQPCVVDSDNFTYSLVDNDQDLELVVEIAKGSITEDRFSKDKHIGAAFSSKRYEHYLRSSYSSPSDEIWLLKSKQKGEPIFFRSHRRLHNREVLLLLGGTSSKYKNLGIGAIAWNFTVNQMLDSGVERATTHISAANIGVFNLEIHRIGFRVRNTFAVLRKIYKQGKLTD